MPAGRSRVASCSSAARPVSGKTALLRRFRDELEPTQRVLWGGCDALFTPRPLGPLLAVAEEVGGELAEVVSRGVMPHEVVAVLARELRRRPSSCSKTCTGPTRRHSTSSGCSRARVETMPVLLVASYRDDQLDRAHPLRNVLGELATSVAVTRVRIDALSPAAVAQLAAPHGVDADELYRKTAGNPFFVVEVLAAGATAIPDTVRDAVLARAAALSPGARSCWTRSRSCRQQAELCAARGARRRRDRLTRRVPRLRCPRRRPAGVAFRHELARLAFEEAIPLNQKVAAAPSRSRRARRRARRRRGPRAARPPRRGGRGTRTPSVATPRPPPSGRGSLGAHREAAAQYARALRFGDGTLRARASRAPRAPRARVLPDRSVRRGDRRARGGAPMPPRARAHARGGRRTAATVGVPLVPGPHRRGRALGTRCGRVARGASARAASSPTPTRISLSSTRLRRGRGGRRLRAARARARGALGETSRSLGALHDRRLRRRFRR